MGRGPIRAFACAVISEPQQNEPVPEGCEMSTTSLLFRNFVYVVALGTSTLPLSGLPVHVTLVWAGGTPSSPPASVHIAAIRTAGTSAGGPPVQTEGGSTGMFLNLGEGVWQVQASSSGYWSVPVEVVVQRQVPASARVVFWPAASLQGLITTAGGEPPPDTVEIHLSATPNAAAQKSAQPAPGAGPARADLRCPVQGGRWNCFGPAGIFDLKLMASGYAPRYEWGLFLKAGQTADLGRADLLRTASVFGRIIRKDGSNPPGSCRATLLPSVERRGPGEPDEDEAGTPGGNTNFSVTSNP